MLISRRSLVLAAPALLAAPAIVKASSLMPIFAERPVLLDELPIFRTWREPAGGGMGRDPGRYVAQVSYDGKSWFDYNGHIWLSAGGNAVRSSLCADPRPYHEVTS